MNGMMLKGTISSCHKNQWWNYITLSSYHTTLSGSPQNNSHFSHFVMNPSDEESNSFSTSRSSLVIGRFKIWLGPPFLLATQSVMLRTSFFASASIPAILAIGHWFQWQSSLSKMISLTEKFWILFFHICLQGVIQIFFFGGQ